MKSVLLTMAVFVLAGVPGTRAAWAQGISENSALTAITGGTLIDVEAGKAVPDSVILIKGDRIQQVGEVGKIAVPAEAKVIDARGKWIIPGLTDMHVHLVAYHYQLPDILLKFGVTTVRDCGGDVTPLRLLREDINAGKKAGPRLFFAGPLLDGDPPVHPSSITLLADTPERARSGINFLADQGVDFIKVYNGVSEATLAEIIATAHERNITVTGHVPRAITLTRAVEMGMDGLEHVRITAKDILPADELAEANRIDALPVVMRESEIWSHIDLKSKQIHDIIALLVRKQVYLDPTLTVAEGLYVDGMMSKAMRTDPNNQKLLPPAILDPMLQYVDRESSIYALPAAMKPVSVEGFKKREQFVGMCSRAGVRLLAGTDSFGLGKEILGLSLHHELELLVQAGLSPMDALRAATITPAQDLRRENDLGSIKAGKLADLVVLNADPLADIRNTKQIDLVMKGGQVFNPTSGTTGAPIGQ